MVQSFSFTHPLDAPQKKYIKENEIDTIIEIILK